MVGLERRLLRGGIGLLGCAGALVLAAAAGAGEKPFPANGDAGAEEMALLELYFGAEQLVEAATRHPKPLSQVAENVTVVTAREIEAMHAHTVAEVLERVPGMFVQFYGRGELGSRSGLFIHGSDYEQVLVLVDGIRWNTVGADFAETNDIPVAIIDRIEVIKGAASSAWGSALGGVVNIITRETGGAARPAGALEMAAGEGDSEHYQAELTGGLQHLGYYLYAGRREAGGLLFDRSFDDQNAYAKLSCDLPGSAALYGAIGYAAPEDRYLAIPAWDFSAVADSRKLFYSAGLDTNPTDRLHLHFLFHGMDERFTNQSETLALPTVLGRDTEDEESRGINSRLAWDHGRHTLVAGAEYLLRQYIQRDDLTGLESPSKEEEILAFYASETLRLGSFTLTPGLRFDHLSVGDDQVSPSAGLTWQWSRRTLFRGAVSRGFRKPTLVLTDDSRNPELESETIWSYQAGVESTAVPWLWLKATGFLHQAEHVWIADPDLFLVNGGGMDRYGLEAEIKTAPFHHLALGASYTWVRLDPDQGESDNQETIKLLLEYDNRCLGLLAQLFGHSVQWSDSFAPPDYNGQYDDFLWDLAVRKTVLNRPPLAADLFFKAHNLFNGSQFHDEILSNAPRWLEAGLRLRF